MTLNAFGHWFSPRDGHDRHDLVAHFLLALITLSIKYGRPDCGTWWSHRINSTVWHCNPVCTFLWNNCWTQLILWKSMHRIALWEWIQEFLDQSSRTWWWTTDLSPKTFPEEIYYVSSFLLTMFMRFIGKINKSLKFHDKHQYIGVLFCMSSHTCCAWFSWWTWCPELIGAA